MPMSIQPPLRTLLARTCGDRRDVPLGELDRVVAGEHPTRTACSACTAPATASSCARSGPAATSVRAAAARAARQSSSSSATPPASTTPCCPARQALDGYRLEVTYGDGPPVTVRDAYSFPPTLGELDLHLIAEGRHEQLWDALGAHAREIDGVARHRLRRLGARTRARSRVVGDFNAWDERAHPMRSLGDARASGSSSCPEAEPGHGYKFEIRGADGVVAAQGRPAAPSRAELPPRDRPR